MNRSLGFIFIFLFVCVLLSKGQYYDKDARLWLYIKLDKKITPRLKAQFILQNRFNNNVSEYSQLNANIELNYKLNKGFRLTTGYVIGKIQNMEGYYFNRQQAYAGFSYRYRIHRLKIVYRNLIQAQTKKMYDNENGQIISFFDRNKITLNYDYTKRLEFYVAQEFNSPFYRFNEMPVNRFRSFVGTVYNLSKTSYLELYFMFQTKYTFKHLPNLGYVYGITYSHSF